MDTRAKRIVPPIIALIVLAADQIVKSLCAAWLPTLPNGSYAIIEGVFHLTYVKNSGAAFGMLSGSPWVLYILTFALSLALLFLLIKKYKAMYTLMRLSLFLILAGALGNLIDRIFLGYVRDMFDLRFINFYVFNVADSAITVGTIALALDILFFKGKDFLNREFADGKRKKDEPLSESSFEQEAYENQNQDAANTTAHEQREK